jgi:hypothetical protein
MGAEAAAAAEARARAPRGPRTNARGCDARSLGRLSQGATGLSISREERPANLRSHRDSRAENPLA